MNRDLDAIIAHHPTDNIHRPILLHAMGLLSLADYLDRHGFRSQVVNLAAEKKATPGFSLAAYLKETGVRVLGLSLHWVFQLPDTLALAEQIKKEQPDVFIVLGGFTASFFARDILADHPYVDAVIKGDGELPLLKLCQSWVKEELSLKAVPNLVYRENGKVFENPTTFVAAEEDLGCFRFTRVDLFKNIDVFDSLIYYPTKRQHERFNFGNTKTWALETGRGCPFSCSLCGGNHKAQKIINNRTGYVFVPVDQMIETIKEAIAFGYTNFYLCFDPDPQRRYYLELFRKIRAENLSIRFMFECWSLPSIEFINAFVETFDDGILALSPDSADEDVRRKHKGPIAYCNDEFLDRLQYIQSKGILCQVYFGFFLPGDTAETVMKTRRFAAELESQACEVFYLGFSTDPGSMVYLYPETYDVTLDVKGLRDYQALLPKKRITPNLLAHRPNTMTVEEVNYFTLILNIDLFVNRILPESMRMLRNSCFPDIHDFHTCVERILDKLATELPKHGGSIRISNTANEITEILSEERALPEDRRQLLIELIQFEAWPYVMRERHFANLGVHYTSICREVEVNPDDDVATSSRKFSYNMKKILSDLKLDRPFSSRPFDCEIRILLDRSGGFATEVV